MLSIKGINIKFDKVLFHDFDFSCGIHQITAISGKSGFGKTTLLNLISQNIQGYKTYEIDGEQIDSQLLNQNVWYVRQDPLFEEDLTMRENLNLLYAYDQKSKDSELEQVLAEELEITHTFLLYPNTLSDGEKKRFSLLIACVLQRKIVLLDEPTASLNDEMVDKTLRIIQKYLSNSAVIISTHEQKVLAICDVVYTLLQGDVSKEGTITDDKFCLEIKKKKPDLLNYYWKSLKHHKVYHIIAQCLITISICALGLGLFSVDVYVKDQEEQLNSLFTNQFVVYAPLIEGATYNQNEYPLTVEQLAELKSMKSVRSVRELYCYIETNAKEMKLKNKLLFPGDKDTAIEYISYDDTKDIEQYIDQKINDEGIYITKELAEHMGNLQQGDSLTFSLPVPEYNVFNEGFVGDDMGNPLYYIVYPKEHAMEVTFPIAGVLKDDISKMGMSISTVENVIYLPQSVYQTYINEQNPSTGYKEGEAEYRPYQPNAYVVELTSVKDIAEFKDKLVQLGLGCDSEYFDVYAYLQTEASTKAFQQRFALLLCGGMVLLVLVLKYLKRNIDLQFFYYIKAVSNDVSFSQRTYRTCLCYRACFDFLVAMLCCLLILLIASQGFQKTYTLPLFTYVICFLFSLLIEGSSLLYSRRVSV